MKKNKLNQAENAGDGKFKSKLTPLVEDWRVAG